MASAIRMFDWTPEAKKHSLTKDHSIFFREHFCCFYRGLFPKIPFFETQKNVYRVH